MELSQFFQLNTTCNYLQLQPNINTTEVVPKFRNDLTDIDLDSFIQFVFMNTTIVGLFFETNFQVSWSNPKMELILDNKKQKYVNFQPKRDEEFEMIGIPQQHKNKERIT
jgi:hypothetical protein